MGLAACLQANPIASYSGFSTIEGSEGVVLTIEAKQMQVRRSKIQVLPISSGGGQHWWVGGGGGGTEQRDTRQRGSSCLVIRARGWANLRGHRRGGGPATSRASASADLIPEARESKSGCTSSFSSEGVAPASQLLVCP
jgi:hypothetical protein